MIKTVNCLELVVGAMSERCQMSIFLSKILKIPQPPDTHFSSEFPLAPQVSMQPGSHRCNTFPAQKSQARTISYGSF